MTAPVTLDQSYANCRKLARRHGTTYYWATMLLPRVKRHHVWALYAFCRLADDVVDDLGDAPVDKRERELHELGARLHTDVGRGASDDPVLKAVVHTIRAFGHNMSFFDRFLASMAMDLTVAEYATWHDLLVYMDGSAAVIGEMLLPILEPMSPSAFEPARQLGLAFQLTNFLRDVGEDLERNRVYVPQQDLVAFGADPHRRVVDDAWRALMGFEIDRCRVLYAQADEGIALLPPASARCVGAARLLYSEILDRIEARDYDVFSGRATVPTRRKLAVAGLTAASR